MGPPTDLPTGTVTFLFSDIEGSTRLLRQLGPRYAEALSEHQRLLREAFSEHGGHEIDTQGDSFFVAFRRAKDAVAAAVAGQLALAKHEWPDGAELRVRMGIHTGEPLADTERYVGIDVHRAARIGATAVGGQVLLSETTRSLLRDDPPPDVMLRDLGRRRLKDMTEPERLFEVKAPGLPVVERRSRPRAGARRRLVIGVALGAIVLAAALGTLFSRGSGGVASAAAAVEPNEVGVIDSHSGSSRGQIRVGAAPNGIAATEGAIWVANTDDNSVTRIDPTTYTQRQTIQVGSSPAGVAASPGAVWVANAGDSTVSRIDPTTNQVTQVVDVGNGPEGVAYGAGKVWVANAADGTLSELNPVSGHVERTVPGAVGVTALTVAFGHLWLAAPASGAVVELDPQGGGATTISVGHDPAALTAAAGAIWVANRQDGTVMRIDPNTASVTDTKQVGAGPDALAGTASGIWIANAGDGTLSMINPASDSVVKTVSVSNPPQGLAILRGDLYVSVRSNGTTNRGGTLRADVGWGAPDFFDPAYAYTPTSWAILAMTNDGLVGLRRVGGAEGTELVPDLAQALPAPTDGGRTYTFTLRSGIRYSTGRLVEPGDVKADIERALAANNPPSSTRSYWTSIVGANRCSPGEPCHLSAGIVTSQDTRTITFHLTQPDPDFLTKLAMPPAFAVPAQTPTQPQAGVPATGPYVATYDKKNRVVRLARNPHFHVWSADAQPDGFPDRIEITWPRDSESPEQAVSTFVSSVKGGTSDVAIFGESAQLPRRTLDDLATRFPSQLKENPRPATWYFFLNTRVPPFDDARVRRAVAEAFDRQAFGRLLAPQYTTTCNILPQGYPGYQRGCPGGASSHLTQARALIRASGRAGARVVAWAPAPNASEARYMASLLDSLGFRASVHVVPAAKTQQDYWPKILDAHTRVQTGYWGWIADYPSSLSFFDEQFSCAAFTPDWQTNGNVAGLCDRSIDAEIHHAAQVQALDPPAATLLWQKVERDIRAAAPMIPTYNGRAITFVSRRVGNFQYNPQWGPLLDQLWVH
jgi:YVTN family beta-propeller protein